MGGDGCPRPWHYRFITHHPLWTFCLWVHFHLLDQVSCCFSERRPIVFFKSPRPLVTPRGSWSPRLTMLWLPRHGLQKPGSQITDYLGGSLTVRTGPGLGLSTNLCPLTSGKPRGPLAASESIQVSVLRMSFTAIQRGFFFFLMEYINIYVRIYPFLSPAFFPSFLAARHGSWDLSSLTRGPICAPCSRNLES